MKSKDKSDLPDSLDDWLRESPRRILRRILYLAIPTGLLLLLDYFQLISPGIYDLLAVCLVVLLFLFSMPLSLLFRLDELQLNWSLTSSNSSASALLVALVFLIVNAYSLSLLALGIRILKKKIAAKLMPPNDSHR